ncbi:MULTISPECIES: ArsR/SmtB family transcription factor [Frankia]|uniref:HTH-type transcriptional regulator n=1 Tax=Frankia alni (strain DSM 45986 / CECT 9034 / ACN14a) TaxID=326424 RepID=Q0RPM5_FRAAA|nr:MULTISPECIES: helix-turn-helix domain-containing protein [Frankia]CAJ60506.1 Putative HTH-type transcriptional regulator [Frankia alni ACN14a]
MLSQHPLREQIRLESVLTALGNSIRLEIVRILDEEGERSCGTVGASLRTEISKSTLTHHWRVLRDSGVIWQRPAGRENLLSLRREDLAVRFPGLLEAVLRSDGAGQ